MTQRGGCHCGRIAFEVEGPTCGCAPFGVGTDRKGEARAAINVRCLEGVDLSALEVVLFDGRSL